MRQSAWSRGVAVLAAAAFFWTIALSVSPSLHDRVHAGQNRTDHSCAVTFLSSGSYYHSATPPIGEVGRPAVKRTAVPGFIALWIPSPFLTAAIFEHGPPAIS